MAHICTINFNKLCGRLITFQIFVHWQCLIAQNVAELFNLNRGIWVSVKGSRAKDMSRGSILGMRFSQATSGWLYRKLLAENSFLLVFCVFSTNSSTMTAAGAIRRRHLPDGSIQWFLVKPWMCSIGQCAPHCTATSAWWSKLPAISLHISLSPIICLHIN